MKIKMNLTKDVIKSRKIVNVSSKEMKSLKKAAAKRTRANANLAIRTGNYDKVYNFVGVTGRDIS